MTHLIGVGTQAGESIDFSLGDLNRESVFTQTITTSQGLGTFQAPITLDTGSFSVSGPVSGDVDNDGDIDYITTDTLADEIQIYLNDGSGNFTEGPRWDVDEQPLRILANDYDGDGNLDLAVYTADDDKLNAFLGNGDGSFDTRISVPAFDFLSQMEDSDVDGDGDLDLVLTGASDGAYIYLNDGAGAFSFRGSFGLGHVTELTLDDFNGDGTVDAAIRSSNDNDVRFYSNNGAGVFTFESSNNIDRDTRAFFTIDYDGDGDRDFGYYQFDDDELFILGNNGDFTFTDVYSASVGFDSPSGAIDFDNDGDEDIIMSDYVFLNDGAGAFTSSAFSPQSLSGKQVADFNGDGVLDIVGYDNVGTREIATIIQNGSSTTTTSSALNLMNISTQAQAQDVLAVIDEGLNYLNEKRAEIGAVQSRLESASQNTSIMRENIAAARSQIEDADVAEEAANLSKDQILQQAGIAVLSQANVSLQITLELLRF